MKSWVLLTLGLGSSLAWHGSLDIALVDMAKELLGLRNDVLFAIHFNIVADPCCIPCCMFGISIQLTNQCGHGNPLATFQMEIGLSIPDLLF
jgi:hypothetical protein